MATNKGSLRSISDASIETKVPISTIREWDPFIEPLRLGNSNVAQRVYDDSHIAKIQEMAARNKRR
jgi:hypothetical protein